MPKGSCMARGGRMGWMGVVVSGKGKPLKLLIWIKAKPNPPTPPPTHKKFTHLTNSPPQKDGPSWKFPGMLGEVVDSCFCGYGGIWRDSLNEKYKSISVVHFFVRIGLVIQIWDEMGTSEKWGSCCPASDILVDVPARKLTWQWNIHHLKMYFLLNMVIFQCHVSFQGSSTYSTWLISTSMTSKFEVWDFVSMMRLPAGS